MTGFVSMGGGATVPSGVITMWSGSTTDVPDGWTLCDGSDGTPDLTDRFVVGAGDSYAVDDTGGAASVQLSEDEMPSHSHNGSTTTDGEHSHDYTGVTFDGEGNGSIQARSQTTRTTEPAGDHSHNLNIDQAGGDSAHENRPPYLALAFIMKT
ncbi:hypothetical protein [Halobaculum magnesiiphilum]|uniref:Microcystin-dependent protein n=1 Tax=Halobaculum magnesiiphilum TaxID=1017351 RepID=A0A8T8WD24_9EURY|nr:hypothetical protein [Halobaculum magnesiiphilum]QZP37748.1 hypothetical protein K6T50_00780 [Halobaculum magnesiiphilum]